MTFFSIGRVFERDNSVLFEMPSQDGFAFYEKLSNTVHFGDSELADLQARVEAVRYRPRFESDSLRREAEERLESLVLNVTEGCNLACSYCIFSGNYENERIETDRDMDFDTAKKALDFFISRSKNPAMISFYGGEPINNMELITRVVDYARGFFPDKEFAFTMTSNFYNADKFLHEIAERGIYVTISLDGPKEVHDKNRRTKNGGSTHRKILRNIEIFEESYPGYAESHFSYNATCENPYDLLGIIRFFNENDRCGIVRIGNKETKGFDRNSREENSFNFSLLSQEYIASIVSGRDPKILRTFFDQELKRVTLRDTGVMPEELMLDGCCYPGNRKLFVDTGGAFYMCERFGGRASIGNVSSGINLDIVNNIIEEFMEIRDGSCGGCWAQRLCAPCIQSSKDPSGDISSSGMKQLCGSYKSQILVALAQNVILSKWKGVLEKYINSIELV
ncbi:MAG: radical SAM protein [Nanoarchaeota archaeon]|nr:radical SAM protein [Nanoarchaeota archaeon]